ncbi:anti-sigma factor antagonist [Pseudomethylobacillus aquaticus]|uniref:Anti-sigma factor antagonist n=1 Tax=Pseudomethylobacillus aquaticus TaxID=2676064 RepID=A0A3N0V328_9PROT|nr:STAS domain-containing protein [Pseudomethylobacillus aquaticus]ROH86954.1 anti-sigma factor antagonist [Pseudomethylobacillus aquaticus]
MFLDEKTVDGVSCISFNQERFDAAKVVQFKQFFVDAVAAGKTRLVLDLTAVKFMDSSALGAVVAVLKTVGARGDLVLCGATGIVAELFKLTRMDRVFVIVASEADAVAKLNS